MAFKFVIFALLVAAANAGHVVPAAYAAPLAYAAPVAKAIDADYDPNPQYTYAYDVHDSLTGDIKSQQESRNGDVVQGSYSLVEADGSRRIVDYTADPENGFNAVIRKEAAKIAAAPISYAAAPAPVAYAAPLAKYAAPVAYSAPVAKYAAPIAYAAPLAKYAAPVAYAAPIAKVAAPAPAVIAQKVAAPLAYAAAPAVAAPAPLSYIAHVSYSTPLFSYSH